MIDSNWAKVISDVETLKREVANLKTLSRSKLFQGVYLTRITSTQSLTTGIWTPVIFNQEILDVGDMHDLTTNPERITCKAAGLYSFWGWSYVESNSTGERFSCWKKNGVYVFSNSTPASASYGTHFLCAGAVTLAVDDYLTFEVYQDSGSTLDLDAAGGCYARAVVARIR